MKGLLQISGKLNLDASRDVMPKGDYADALNMTSMDNDGNKSFVKRPIPGTRLFDTGSYSMPAGVNYSLGVIKDKTNNRIIDFLWNSEGNNQIREWSFTTGKVTVLFADNDATYTDSQKILGWTQNSRITSIKLIHTPKGDLLCWAERDNPPREINIDISRNTVATTDMYYGCSAEDITIAKPPPLISPSSGYFSDSGFTHNNVRGRLFQFCYGYIYYDDSKSTYSPWGEVPLPSGETDPATNKDQTENNGINIAVVTGTVFVKKIEIIGRIGIGTQGEWSDAFLIDTIDNDLSKSSIIYKFYNNSNYVAIDQFKAAMLYSAIPQLAEVLDFVNGNVPVVGCITEGYNYDDVTLDVALTSTYESYPHSSGQQLVPLKTSDFTINMSSNGNHAIFDVAYAGQNPLHEGENIIVKVHAYLYLHAGLFGLGHMHKTYDFYLYFSNTVLTGHKDIDTGHEVMPIDEKQSYYIESVVGNSVSKSKDFYSISSFELNSQYQLGMVYKDGIGRTNSVYTGDNLRFSTVDYVDEKVNNEWKIRKPLIKLDVNHRPPSWAKAFSFCLTKNLTEDYFLYWQPLSIKKDNDYYYLDVSNIAFNGIEVNKATNLKYDFVQGDRVVVYSNMKVANLTQDVVNFNTSAAIVGLFDNPKVGNGENITGGQVVNPGKGYTGTVTLEVQGGGGNGAQLRPVVYNGQIVDVIVDNEGIGYTSMPDIIVHGNGSEASIVPIIGYYKGTFLKIPNNGDLDIFLQQASIPRRFGGSSDTAKMIIKIFRPAKNTSSQHQVFFEIGKEYTIEKDGNGNPYHTGDIQTQSNIQPAKYEFNYGDDFLTTYAIPSVIDQLPVSYFDPSPVIAQNFDDNFPSASWSKGRAVSVFKEAKRDKYEAVIRWGGSIIRNTEVNEINIFKEADLQQINIDFGAIRRFVVRENFVRVFQQFNVGRLPVYQSLIKTAAGNDILSQSDKIINRIQYPEGEQFGIGDAPGSLSTNGFADYFVDTNKGVHVRFSGNGMEALSRVYSANSLFTNRSRYYSQSLIDNTSAKDYDQQPAILSAFNTDTGENIVFFLKVLRLSGQEIKYDLPEIGITFSENMKGYDSKFNFCPENLIFLNGKALMFKDGQLYIWDDTTNRALIFGQQKQAYITCLFTENLMHEKDYLSIKEISSGIWPIDSIETSLGQQSNLGEQMFESMEGNPEGSFLRDINSPGGLINGDPLKGKWMELKFLWNRGRDDYITIAEINYNLHN